MKKAETKPEFTQKPPSTKVEHAEENTALRDSQPKTFTVVSGPNGNQGGN